MGPKYYVRGYQLDDNNEEVTEYKDIGSGFTDFASTHGIPHIARAAGVFKKGVWLLVTLTCVAGLIYNFFAITSTYLSYPVYVHSTIKQSQGITFPAVSICNSNPVKKSAVLKNERLLHLLASWESTKKRRKRRDVEVIVPHSLEKDDILEKEVLDDLLTKWQSTNKRRRKRQTSSCPNPTHNDICYWKHCEENDGGGGSMGGWGGTGCAAKSFADASTICQDEGGILAVVDTQAKQDHIVSVLDLGTDSSYEKLWIDLVYDPSESDWIWSETSQLGSNWNYWDPDPGTPTDNICACTSNSKWETNVCEIVIAWSGGFFGCYPLCQDNRPYVSSITTTAVEPAIPETTTVLQTTSQPERSTRELTTVPVTTTMAQTTPQLTTTYALTTAAETTIPETTTVLQKTSQPETSTRELTTVPVTTTMAEITPELTTTYAPSTAAETTGLETTTIAESTTASQDTTSEPDTTTVSETTTEQETITTTTTKPITTSYHSAYADREPPREDYQKESDLMEALADIPLDEKKSIGYNYPEFILECVYNGKECFESQFEHFFDAVHGNCYVFNSGWNSSQPLKVSSYTGRIKGLHLYLNLGQSEYIESVSEGAGAIVVVNNQSSMPFPADVGILAPPGYITSVGIRKLEVYRLGNNYGNCVERDNEGVEKNMFSDEHPVKYSFSACQKTCYQKNVIGTCGCADPQYPINSKAFGDVTVSSCDARNQTQDDCVYGVTLLFINDDLDCSCESPCSNQYFTHSISKILWPSEKEKDTVTNRYQSKIFSTSNISVDDNYLTKNFLKVEVYFEELNSEYMQEKPKYNFARYISDVGSIIGLWLGCSVLSLLEFLELGLDTLVYSVMYCKRKRSKLTDSMTSLLTRNTKRKISPVAADHTKIAADMLNKQPRQRGVNNRGIRNKAKQSVPILQEASEKDMFSNIPEASPVDRRPSPNSDEGYSSRESIFTTNYSTSKSRSDRVLPHEKFVFGASS